MIKNNLSAIDNVAIYPQISFLIFIAFFVMLIFWVLKMNKTHVDYIKNIPLDENEAKSDFLTINLN